MLRRPLLYAILSALRNLFRNSLLLLATVLFEVNTLCAQNADTVVVYEYVYVTDTVWVEPARDTVVPEKLKPVEGFALIIDSLDMNSRFNISSPRQNTIIPIDRILRLNDQQKLTNITLFGVPFLVISSSLFEQPKIEKNIGLYLRGNYGIQTAHYYEVEKSKYYTGFASETASTEASPVVGIKGNLPINSYLSVSPRISFTYFNGLTNDHFLGLNEDVEDYSAIIVWDKNSLFSLEENGYEKSYQLYSEKEMSTSFYFLSTDFLLNYYFIMRKQTKYRLYGGLRTDFLVYQNSAGMDLSEANYTGFKKLMFNYVGGIGFDFGKRVYLELEYSNHINNFVNTDYMWVKYGAVSINVGYYLF